MRDEIKKVWRDIDPSHKWEADHVPLWSFFEVQSRSEIEQIQK